MRKNDSIKTVSVVGSGNLAWHMAKALNYAGISVLNIISRNPLNGEQIADEVSATMTADISGIDQLPDLFLICVSDGAIPGLIKQYRNLGAMVAHTSGSTGIDVFGSDYGPHGVFYPLQTFSRMTEMDYSAIPFLIEGSSKDSEN